MFDSSDDEADSIFELKYSDSIPAISRAIMDGNLGKVKKLILGGSLPQTPDNIGWTSIHCCVASNQIQALKLILDLKPKNKRYLVNLKTWEGVTPLLVAAKAPKPSIKMMKLLLKAGADPKQCTPTNFSPLHLACEHHGNIECVKLLVLHGADVNAQEDFNLSTPLHFAISKAADLEMIRFLVNLTDLTLKNSFDRTPFLEACYSNFTEAVKVFLEYDAELAKVNCHLPPLVYSGFTGNLEMTKLLIHSGADVNCRCKAMVPHKTVNSDCILFDQENFLPIHSSLTNIEVFMLLLKLTKWERLLGLEKIYYSFSLFVLIFADEIFIENLLQSGLPNKLKTFESQVLVTFILKYPDLEEIIANKFHNVFKYNFSLTPESVFQCFANNMNKSMVKNNIRHLNLLATMGISSAKAFQSKNVILKLLEDYMTEKDTEDLTSFKSTFNILSVSVLTLKQLCRITLRNHINSLKCDWLALKMIRELKLPDAIKKFILFESPA